MNLSCFPFIALGLVWECKLAGGVCVEALNLSPLPSVCLDWSYLKRFTGGCSAKAALCRVGLLLLRHAVFLTRALIPAFLYFKIVRLITKKDAYSVNVLKENCILSPLNPLTLSSSNFWHSYYRLHTSYFIHLKDEDDLIWEIPQNIWNCPLGLKKIPIWGHLNARMKTLKLWNCYTFGSSSVNILYQKLSRGISTYIYLHFPMSLLIFSALVTLQCHCPV